MKVNSNDILLVNMLLNLKHIDPKIPKKRRCDKYCLKCLHPVHIRKTKCQNCGFKMR